MTIAGVAGVAAAEEGPEQLPPAPTPALPAPGDTYDLSAFTNGIELRHHGHTIKTDTLEGEIGLMIKGADSPQTVVAQPSGFKLSTQTEQGFGAISIAQNDTAVTPDSLLELVSQAPPKFEHAMVLDFTMTIENPEQNSDTEQYEPLVLTTKDPAMLLGQLTQFPPKGDIYQLQNPIDLVNADNPDVTVATIEKFPVKVGGL